MSRRLLQQLRMVWCLAAFAVLAIARPAYAESRYIEGAGGVPIAVTVAGPEDGPAILFLHGLGMGAESFRPQFQSDLKDRFRLVAMDLRGHGMSGKPWTEESYTDTRLWAKDVARVIAATDIERPVIVAWSYGTLVASDFIRHMGTDAISGLVLIGAAGGLITAPAAQEPPDPDVLAQLVRSRELRALPSMDAQETAVGIVLPMLTDRAPAPEWSERMRLLGMMVPPYAQAPLRKHPFGNADLLARMQNLPVLIAHGEHDPSLSEVSAQALRKVLPCAKTRQFEGSGHSPFAEAPDEFNAMLADFVLNIRAGATC